MIKPILTIYYILTTMFKIYFQTTEATKDDKNEVSVFEYGIHLEGEELSYLFTGSIPPFQPVFILNTTPEAAHLEKRFTYLKAEYINPVSKVEITFDRKAMILVVYQKFPFISMPLGVHGFSMPLNHEKKKGT